MIRILEKHVADKIAAGEVIDRPVSIIKELLENAIDAGADQITVEIRGGGKSYIRVTDNGCGIEADDIETAFQRHATSKIAQVSDLDAINTLGFRGEALASICAVARVEIISKTRDSAMGRRVLTEGSKILANEGIGCPDGTTVTVKDLFYNLPARRKFLSSDNGESRRIIDMVSRIALAYGDIRFTLINGNSRVFTTQGRGNILNSIISVYGKDIGRDLMPVESRRGDFVLKGFVSAPSASATSRSRQIFCVNGRVISSKVMEKALEDAYKEKLFHGRFPIAFLFLSMPPDKLDVNIHPTKKEVRFDDDFEVMDFITKAVRQSLSVVEALPQVRGENVASVVKEEFKDYRPTEALKRESIAPEKPDQGEQVNVKELLLTIRKNMDTESSAMLSLESPTSKPFDFHELHYMGAIFDTYIMACDENCFYLIDQHAAHERVFYEKLRRQYEAADKLSQSIMIPLQFHVAAQVTETEDDWLPEVRAMGYDIEYFGSNTYIVREIPAFMELQEAEGFLEDLLSSMEDRPDLTDRNILDKIIMRSCKSAVKGGDHLAQEEIDALIKDLRGCVNPFSCPHGRPTFIRMTKYEIEKMFKRV